MPDLGEILFVFGQSFIVTVILSIPFILIIYSNLSNLMLATICYFVIGLIGLIVDTCFILSYVEENQQLAL